MSNEKKPEPQRNYIPASMLRLSEQAPVDIPGTGGKNSITCVTLDKVFNAEGKRIGGRAWVSSYYPALQHHRIAFYEHDAREPIVRMVHASFIKCWEPIE